MRVLFSKGIAAISKPRCGSTSIRGMLDPFLDREAGDIAVNMAGQRPPFHPHMTAPYLRQVLEAQGHDAHALEYFVTIRHPVRMLQSYYRFFKPDAQGRYNFAPNWDGSIGMGFEQWVLTGRLGMSADWQGLAPEWVTTKDLSPLSLEACAMRRDGSMAVDHVFRIEDPDRICAWLSQKLGQRIEVRHVNRSEQIETAPLGYEALEKVRQMMPMESGLYAV
jgi:hypothetical protein